MLSYTLISITASLVLSVAYALYRTSLPRPIPGIPYNKHSAKSILGDVPDLLAYHAKTSEVYSFIRSQALKFNEPVIQLFLRPFGRPFVIVSDFRETQDILVRRSREFDRSRLFGDLFSSGAPSAHVHFPTNERWKSHRKLVADAMSPAFLANTAAPEMHKSALVLLDLWRHKARLAKGRPFSIENDMQHTGLDIIWKATFGGEMNALQAQVDSLASKRSVSLPESLEEGLTFEEAAPPEGFKSIATLSGIAGIAQSSPFPRWHAEAALRFVPKYRGAMAHKNQILQQSLDTAWAKFSQDVSGENRVKSVLELFVQREVQMATKENRKAVYDSPAIKDELFSFLIAGHDTSATTLSWAMKFLSDNQAVQHRLRSELQAVFPEAHAAGDNPEAKDMSKARVPYLDAVTEEVFRLGGTVPFHARNATVDAEVLGHVVPKGTDVIFLANGAGFTMPAMQVDENSRSASSQASKDKNGVWDDSTIGEFHPERWLVLDESGEVEFNARAGPVMPFGAGPRACFGRKLAELELRIVLILIAWNFQLEPIPAALATYDAQDIITHMPQQCYVRLSEAR